MIKDSVSIAMTGSGGAGVLTAGNVLLQATSKAGYHGIMGRAVGPQIRGGETAALLRISDKEILCHGDHLDLLIGFDWDNYNRFASELSLTPETLVIVDPDRGDLPSVLLNTAARIVEVPIKQLAAGIPGGRPNMIGVGLIAGLSGLPLPSIEHIIEKTLGRKGPEAVASSIAAVHAGAEAGADITLRQRLAPANSDGHERWAITGNEATALGAVRGGIRFCAAYPITPATEILEWLAPNLPRLGGSLIQAEDELASINMCLGASFGGVPAMTSTSGPGLSLMTESLGLAVAAEIPVLVVDVQRGGPSTGIPTKSEQGDLNVAVFGLHGDAPQVVTAPLSIADCSFTAQWSVILAEALQTPVLMLSDQYTGQTRAVIERPRDIEQAAERLSPQADAEGYRRYSLTANGISPMAVPGTAGCEYTTDGLEHDQKGTPSTQAENHQDQLDKRLRKLTGHDYGGHWGEVVGEGPIAVLTWGSVAAPVREAVERLTARGVAVRHIAVRLIFPLQAEKLAAALAGVKKVVVVEQNHGGQFYHYAKGAFDFPCPVQSFARPGPLPFRPHEIEVLIEGLCMEKA